MCVCVCFWVRAVRDGSGRRGEREGEKPKLNFCVFSTHKILTFIVPNLKTQFYRIKNIVNEQSKFLIARYTRPTGKKRAKHK